jgi:hypothetical protein
MPVDVRAYGQSINSVYFKDDEVLSRETYLCAVYLPAGPLKFLIKHPQLGGVFYQENLTVPREKHMSINKYRPLLKMIKKVKEIRHFSKPSSVFAKWKNDTKDIIEKCYETDMALTKIHKFIKDEYDREQTFKVLRKYYGNLKNQFVSQIANPKSYPVIDWLDFVDACEQWKIVDKNLTSQDIDRIFIATNFEEEDLEENDDNSLCRFEFSEIIARCAKCKYFEKGICSTVHESVERLI